MNHNPSQPKPQSETKATDSGNLSQETSASRELRIQEQVAGALSESPGGKDLARYFGTEGSTPKQPPLEAGQSECLIQDLKTATETSGDLTSLLRKMEAHNAASGADPDALRALMRGPKKPRS